MPFSDPPMPAHAIGGLHYKPLILELDGILSVIGDYRRINACRRSDCPGDATR